MSSVFSLQTDPQITSYRGSPTYTVFFLTHVTCHSFQVLNQPALS